VKIIQHVDYWSQAKQILEAMGFQFDRVLVPQGHREQSQYCPQHTIAYDLLHWHFMVGDADIAYWTPIMNTLAILDAPRPWAQKFLANTREAWNSKPTVYSYVKTKP
jgi:hypothetical protein